MFFKYLLIAFQEEEFPNDRWGTYGSHSKFLKETYELYETENLYKRLGEFIYQNPNCEYFIYLIRSDEVWDKGGGLYIDEDFEDVKEEINKLEHQAIDYSKQLKEKADVAKKQKELEKKLLEKKRIEEDELKKLAELKAKYEK